VYVLLLSVKFTIKFECRFFSVFSALLCAILELLMLLDNAGLIDVSYFNTIISAFFFLLNPDMKPCCSKNFRNWKFCLECFTVNLNFLARKAVIIRFKICTKEWFIRLSISANLIFFLFLEDFYHKRCYSFTVKI